MNQKPVRVLDPARTALIVFGCGGTGGHLLQCVCRLLYGMKEQSRAHPGALTPFGEPSPEHLPDVLVCDGDTVERANVVRQPYLPQDVGKKKSTVLAGRYAAIHGLKVYAYPEYLSAPEELRRLVPEGAIVVGCVDNAKTRRILHEGLSAYEDVVYLDSGNAGVELPDGAGPLPRADRARIKESGWEGQVLCGVRKGGETVVPFPADQIPDLVEGDDLLPNEVPCGRVVESLPQRHMTNLMAATVLMTFLTPLLSDGTLLHHAAFFDARAGYLKSYPALNVLSEVAV